MAMKQITKGYPNWDVPYNENVEEYNNTIGTINMGTTATTITGAIKEVKELINTKGGEIQTVVADVNNNKTKIAEHTSQLNDMVNNKANKNNSEFTGTMKLNNKDVATIEHFSPEILNGWIFGFNSSDIYFPTKIIIGNVVVFTGLFYSGVVDIGTIICKLPKPAGRNHFKIFSETGQPSGVYLEADGNLTISSQIEPNTCYMFTIIYERKAQ